MRPPAQTFRFWLLGILSIATTLAIGPVVGEFFVEWAKENKWYEQPSARVEAAMTVVSGVTTHFWFLMGLAFLSGLTAGAWIDAMLRRREASTRPNAQPADVPLALPPHGRPTAKDSHTGGAKQPASIRFSIDQHGQVIEEQKENVASWSIIQIPGADYIEIEMAYSVPIPAAQFNSVIEGRGVEFVVIDPSVSRSRFRFTGETKGRRYRIEAGKPTDMPFSPSARSLADSAPNASRDGAESSPKGSPGFMLEAFAAERAEMVRLVPILRKGFLLDEASNAAFETAQRRLNDLADLFLHENEMSNMVRYYAMMARMRAIEMCCLRTIQAALDEAGLRNPVLVEQQKFMLEKTAFASSSLEKLAKNTMAAIMLNAAETQPLTSLDLRWSELDGQFSIIKPGDGTVIGEYLPKPGDATFPIVRPTFDQIQTYNAMIRRIG